MSRLPVSLKKCKYGPARCQIPVWQIVRTSPGAAAGGAAAVLWQVPTCPAPLFLRVSDSWIVRLFRCLHVLLMLFPSPEMPFHLSLLTGGNQIVADGWDHENFNALSKGKPRGQHQGEGWAPLQVWEGTPGSPGVTTLQTS